MRKLLWSSSIVFVLTLVSSSFALEPILMGDFENGSVEYNSTDIRWDDWMININSSAVTAPAQAVTRGTHALKWVDTDGGDWLADSAVYPYGGTLDEKLEAWLNPGSCIAVDVTAIDSEVTGGTASLALFYNAGGGWGFDDTTWQSVIIDGTAHTYLFYVTDQVRTVIEDSMDTWGCNLGFALRTAAAASITIYLDNIWIYPDGYSVDGPYGRSEEQVFNIADSSKADVTLHWKAAKDPNEDATGNAVNPDIVNQYVFMDKGGTAAETDPNLYYVGATGVDPGTANPDSQYGPVVLPTDTLYAWTVVEAMDGYEQTFTVGVSTLNDVDPNNIVGPKWSFWTLSNLPEISTQPVSKRFGVNDASVQLTIGVTSATPETYQWYYSLDAVADAGDTAISSSIGGDTNTITITAHNKAYQAYYYCKVSNLATIGGGGTKDDVYSNVVSLVVERKVAEYNFDGNLNDTSGMGFNGTGVGSPTFVTGVGGSGQALSLDGTSQYVQIGNPSDPNTFNKCFPRADLLAEDGIGGGLDIGTVMCWIKLNVTDVNEISPILANSNAGWPATWFYFGMDTDSAAANTNMRTFLFTNNGDTAFWASTTPQWTNPYNMGGDGQWHMLAATWNLNTDGTFKQYLDGNLIAQGSSVTTPVFDAWDNLMEIGFDGTNYFGGLIDNLRVYNYEIAAEDIVAEASPITGKPGCINDFAGSNFNVNQIGSSYCKIDLADFAELAATWLNDGFYTAP